MHLNNRSINGNNIHFAVNNTLRPLKCCAFLYIKANRSLKSTTNSEVSASLISLVYQWFTAEKLSVMKKSNDKMVEIKKQILSLVPFES